MIDDGPLRDAAKALLRAADAAFQATRYPNSNGFPCKEQTNAAHSEIKCAQNLIKKALERAKP